MASVRSALPRFSVAAWLGPLALGTAIGVVFAVLLYGLNSPALIILVVAGLAVLLPSMLVKDAPLYWMCVYLFSLQFDVKKNLVNGLAVLDDLKIDYMQFVFTPEIRLSDLPLIAMLLLWFHAMAFRGKPLIWPKHGWLALAFIGWAILSTIKAPHLYLSAIEIVRQCKFFIIFLYAVNNITSMKTVTAIFSTLAIALVLQGAVTLGRYQTQYFEPLESLLGIESQIDAQKRDDALSIDTEGESGFGISEARRSFGTFPSPGTTTKFCLMAFPIALMLTLANPLTSRRGIFFLVVPLALSAFYFSFSRSSMVACLAEIALFCWFGLRRGHVPKHFAIYLLCGVILAGVFASPKLYDFMTSRYDAVEVRLRQYEVTLDMIVSNPVLGVGINNSTGVKKNSTDDSSFVRDPLRRSGEQPIHSFYLMLMAETGVVGFAFFMLFFGTTYRRALALSSGARDKSVAFAATALLICFAGLAVGILTDPLFEDYVQSLLWLYAGLVVALKRMDDAGAEPAAGAKASATG